LSLSEKYEIYAKKVLDLLENHEIRAPLTIETKLGKKIRDAEMQKNPFMLIVGEEEEKNGPSTSRTRRKRKYHRYNRRICCYSKRRDQKNIKSIYSLT
jgi:threonyl-tRNA synthetase